MKNWALVILLVLGVAYTGCKKDGKEAVAGKWKVVDAKIELKDTASELAVIIEQMEKAIVGAEYEFKNDGSYSLTGFGKNVTGEWEYDAGNKAIVLKSDNQEVPENKFMIQSNDGDRMTILNSKEDEGSATIVFERIKEEKTTQEPEKEDNTHENK